MHALPKGEQGKRAFLDGVIDLLVNGGELTPEERHRVVAQRHVLGRVGLQMLAEATITVMARDLQRYRRSTAIRALSKPKSPSRILGLVAGQELKARNFHRH